MRRTLVRCHAQPEIRIARRIEPQRLHEALGGVSVCRGARAADGRIDRGAGGIAKHDVEVAVLHVDGIFSAPDGRTACRVAIETALDIVDAVGICRACRGVREIPLVVHRLRDELRDGGRYRERRGGHDERGDAAD